MTAPVNAPPRDDVAAGSTVAPILLQSAQPTVAADPPPWFSYAQQSSIGTLVLRISLSPGENPAVEPPATARVLQTTFNASKLNTTPAESAAPTQASNDPQITGVVFPGQGVPIRPTDTWPKSIDAFDGQSPPVGAEPQEYFVVLQSDSDAVLGLMSFIIAVAADPVLAQNGHPPSGTSSDGTSNSAGLTSLFGPLGGQGAPSEGDDPAGGLAALFAFAALAGLGDQAFGPTVGLVKDTGASASDGITQDGRLAVTAEPGKRLQYSGDDGRTWKSSYRPRTGRNSVQIRAIDTSGIESPVTPFVFTLDRQAPAAPTVRLALDSGHSASDSLTNTAELNIRRREQGATLEYSVNGGGWTESYAPVEGRNVVRVRQIDTAGNISKPSKPVVFRLDTQVSSVAVAAASAVSRSVALPQLVGLEQGAVVQYSSDGGRSWSQRRPPAALRGSALVRQVDIAGNRSAITSIQS